MLLGEKMNCLEYRDKIRLLLQLKELLLLILELIMILNFESLEKNSIDLYSLHLKVYILQNRENKINNSRNSEDDWGNLDN